MLIPHLHAFDKTNFRRKKNIEDSVRKPDAVWPRITLAITNDVKPSCRINVVILFD